MNTSRIYRGLEISLTWPSAALMPGACRPSYEKWEAWVGEERVAGHSLRQVKQAIKGSKRP